MTGMMKLLRALRRDERGLTTVEYLIVLCLLAAVAVATWRTFGNNVRKAIGASNDVLMGEFNEADGTNAANVAPDTGN